MQFKLFEKLKNYRTKKKITFSQSVNIKFGVFLFLMWWTPVMEIKKKTVYYLFIYIMGVFFFKPQLNVIGHNKRIFVLRVL